MKDWKNDEAFKTLTETHKHLWENVSTIFPHFPLTNSKHKWQEAYASNLTAWQETMKRALTAESAWLEQWVGQMATTQSVPRSMSEWMRQMDEVVQHLIQTQAKLWEDYLRILMSGAGIVPPAEFDFAAEPQESIEPAEQSKSPKEQAESAPIVKPVQSSNASQEADDLKAISGLGPALEKKLNACGIVSYRQIAALSDEDIKRIENSVTGLAGRIRRYNWIEQAKQQHLQKYNERL